MVCAVVVYWRLDLLPVIFQSWMISLLIFSYDKKCWLRYVSNMIHLRFNSEKLSFIYDKFIRKYPQIVISINIILVTRWNTRWINANDVIIRLFWRDICSTLYARYTLVSHIVPKVHFWGYTMIRWQQVGY